MSEKYKFFEGGLFTDGASVPLVQAIIRLPADFRARSRYQILIGWKPAQRGNKKHERERSRYLRKVKIK